MANVFGILTAIVLALSAFIAHKNKSTYDERITQTHDEKDKLAKSEVRLKANEEDLNVTLPNAISGVNAEVDKFTADEAAQKKVNDGLTAQVKEKSDKIAANKQKLDEIREKTKNVGEIDTLASKLRTMNDELAELTTLIDAASAKLANLTAQNSSAESQVAAGKAKFENFTNNQSLPTVNTRIRSIYPNWGFVTLAAGNNAGIVTNSTLNVVRDGQTIAQLLVTAVESNTASASIVPDSMASDVTLMVGDRVVPGIKNTKASGN